MGWAGQNWLSIYQEGTGGANFGTFNTSATPIYPTLYGGNPFTVRIVPQRQEIRTADAGNRRKLVVSAKKQIQGQLSTLLHPDQAAFWVGALTLTSSFLPSYSIEYFDSTRVLRLLGCTIQSFRIMSSADQDYVTLQINWLCQKPDPTFTTFPMPAETNYSLLTPYEHIETASFITMGGTAITKYRNLELTLTNVLNGPFDEDQYINACYYCGRDLDFSVGPQYLATTYRADYEAQTPLAWVVAWERTTPAHTLIFNCQTANYVSSIDDDLPLDGPGYQTITIQSFFDPSSSTDFVATAT